MIVVKAMLAGILKDAFSYEQVYRRKQLGRNRRDPKRRGIFRRDNESRKALILEKTISDTDSHQSHKGRRVTIMALRRPQNPLRIMA